MATLQDTFAKRQAESTNQINDLYNKQYESSAQSLKSDYDQNMSKAVAARDNIAPQYQNQGNALAVQYEKQRRNANLSALNNGLNTGTQQQQQLAYQQNFMNNYGALRNQEAGAMNTANQNIADLTTSYNNALVKARNDANIKRDQALISDYNTRQNWYDQQAATLAKSGNFSAYERLYGKAQADQMRNVWIAQNPLAAYRAGMIDAANYQKLTGKDPNK